MKVHQFAELFPMLSAAELQDLAADIKSHGLQQPCVRQGDVLLDGRNRLAACKIAGVDAKFVEYEGDSPVAFIIGANLKRRHLDKGQKIALGLEIEPYFAAEAKNRMNAGKADPVGKSPTGSGKSRDTAATAVGVCGKILSDAKAIKKASPERFEKIKQGKLSVARAKKELKAEQDEKALKAAQKNVTEARKKELESVCCLRVCSCTELLSSGIRPDAVITDPPYPKEFLSVFTELAKGCAEARVPLVAVMSGQTYLPEVMQRLCEHLKYRWVLAYLTPGGQAVQQWPVKVNTTWKPIILFGEAAEWFGDVAASKTNDNDKRFHGWGQSVSGMADLVERLTKPGQLVCDPFLGGGTTAVSSIALGRRFVGCDTDASCVEKTRLRIEAQS